MSHMKLKFVFLFALLIALPFACAKAQGGCSLPDPFGYYQYDAQADFDGTLPRIRKQARDAYIKDCKSISGTSYNTAAKIIDTYIKNCDKGMYLTEEPDPMQYKLKSRFVEHYVNYHYEEGMSSNQKGLIRARGELAWEISLPVKRSMSNVKREQKQIKRSADILDIEL